MFPEAKLLEKIKELKSIFEQIKEEIICAYLFGSFVKERLDEKSDLDFGILFKIKPKKKLIDELYYQVYKALDFKITLQIIDLATQDLFFKFNVIKEGKILYEADKSGRVRFEVELMKEYAYFYPLMEKYFNNFFKLR